MNEERENTIVLSILYDYFDIGKKREGMQDEENSDSHDVNIKL